MTFWDNNATREGVFNVGDMYDEYTARQADFIVEQLGAKAGLLLDVGCGIGRLAGAVLERLPHVDVIGVDPSRPMLTEAMRRVPRLFVHHKVDDLPTVPPDTLAGAWCVLTFQHLPDHTVKTHLKDLFEILKPGARLVSQWVTVGEPSPMSYPRHTGTVLDWHEDAGFGLTWFTTDHIVTDYADDWIWVVAERPA